MDARVKSLTTPTVASAPVARPSREEAEAAVRTLIAWAGDDPHREGLLETPARVTKAYGELFAGYDQDAGEVLSKTFKEQGIETYLGISVTHFPNFFFLLGPNTALGHNSVVFMIEQQTKWIVSMLDEMDERDLRRVGGAVEHAFG